MKWMPSSPCPVAPQFLQPLNALASKLIGKFNKLMYDSTEDLQIEHDEKMPPGLQSATLVQIGDIIELLSTDNTKQPFTFYNDLVKGIVQNTVVRA